MAISASKDELGGGLIRLGSSRSMTFWNEWREIVLAEQSEFSLAQISETCWDQDDDECTVKWVRWTERIESGTSPFLLFD